MWWLMMIAMMLPSAAPMVLLHAAVTRKGMERNEPDLDSWPGVICSHGEVDARWRRGRKSNGLAAHQLGCLARYHGLLSRAFLVRVGQQEPLDRRSSPSA